MIAKMIEEIHQNAVDHGWWEEDRCFGEVIALIHSELSEALEEFRNGHSITETYYHGEKPEGIPTELIDAVIRIFDYFGRKKLILFHDDAFLLGKVEEPFFGENFADFISHLHQMVSMSYAQNDPYSLVLTVKDICSYLASFGVEPMSIIELKHNYNKTRPYRHGGKKI